MRPVNGQAWHGVTKPKKGSHAKRMKNLGPKAGKCRYCPKVRKNVIAHMKAVHPAEYGRDHLLLMQRTSRKNF
jgi:hypothetical protein